jgi:tricorn protease
MQIRFLVLSFWLSATTVLSADRVQLVTDPNLSPDGKTLLFVYRGDIWRVATSGGEAQRVTSHSASDAEPHYSPDGTQIAFISNRTGSRQVYTLTNGVSEPQQLTWHTEGFSLQDWYPDGNQLLVQGDRDHFWRNSKRFLKIASDKRSAEQMLFNGYGSAGQISPDGSQLLFVREGERWWRKGYQGARSAQVWIFDLKQNSFTEVLNMPTGCFSPKWKPDGSGFYYCGSQQAANGARNLREYSLKTKESRQITHFEDDLVVSPTISADGRTIVFSHLFDLYRLRVGKKAQPKRIEITVSQEDQDDDLHRRTLKTATDATFSKDGLEIAFISGGDLWVMETELREPVQVTATSQFESNPVFINDDAAITCVSWKDGEPDIWRIERADSSKYWWQNDEFASTRITQDDALESKLQLSPDGKHLAYIRGRGDLWLHDLETGDVERLVESFSAPDYDFSPDGKWIVYAQTDNNFNTDIWIAPTDKSSDPVNISRHPDDESGPHWSADGKLIAFTGRRTDDEIDIYYVWLTEEDDDTGSRDRKVKKTLEAFEKSRKKKPDPQSSNKENKPAEKAEDAKTPEAADEDESMEEDDSETEEDQSPKKKDEKKLPEVKIDFTDIHHRLRKISVPNSTERILGWTPDGKKLIFSGTVKGDGGTYSVEFPDKLTPQKITTDTGRIKGWLRKPDRMLWLTSGVPGAQPLTGSGTKYTFSAPQELSRSARHRAGFETAWRIMRDWWYDNNYGNHNWDQIRRKYVDAATSAGNTAALATVVQLMLGELNGSHLGFYPGSGLAPRVEGGDEWRPTTAHPGVRFDHRFKGPGLKVKDIIPEGPATDESSLIHPGEVILSIDGTAVDPAIDLTTVLNGRMDRNMQLKVRAAGRKGKEREVMLRPTTYGRVRSLLYQQWQDHNRKLATKKANNIGYLHIQGMNWSSFLDFERELYDIGYGKDGLIIDVRDNGGGSTTDHLLTALTQPQHAITVPRGGGPGYPQSRMVYATWHKPIVVMCNQNSYSNAEIFSHAIKNLRRGKLIGTPTAGGVISTGARSVMDVGTIRLPFRGWFVKSTGQDMELNGAVPHIIVWPRPAEIPNGVDRQLNKAVQTLRREIKKWKAKEQPPLIKATERAN